MDHTLETTGVRQIINQSINQFMDRSLNVACLSPLTGWITVPTRRVLLMPSRIISTSRCRMRLSVKNFASSAYSSFVPSCLLLGPCQWEKILTMTAVSISNGKTLPKQKISTKNKTTKKQETFHKPSHMKTYSNSSERNHGRNEVGQQSRADSAAIPDKFHNGCVKRAELKTKMPILDTGQKLIQTSSKFFTKKLKNFFFKHENFFFQKWKFFSSQKWKFFFPKNMESIRKWNWFKPLIGFFLFWLKNVEGLSRFQVTARMCSFGFTFCCHRPKLPAFAFSSNSIKRPYCSLKIKRMMQRMWILSLAME